MVEIADRLRLTRLASGLSQAAWCRLVGIAPSAWHNYETLGPNWRRISLDQALKVCGGAGVTLDWIYRGQAAGLPMNLATKIQQLRERAPVRRLTA